MKRLPALVSVTLLFAMLAACTVKTPGDELPPPLVVGGATLTPSQYTDRDFDAPDGLVMTTEYGVYGPDAPEGSYLITNDTPLEYAYGDEYSIEIYLDSHWYQIPFRDGTAFDGIGYALEPDETGGGVFSFSAFDFTFTDGQYRLIKEIGGSRCRAEFKIGDSPITAETPFGFAAPEALPEAYTPEQAADNGDVVLARSDVRNPGKLTDFLEKAALGLPAMVRLTEYTDKGDPIVTDCIYNENRSGYFLFRRDNTRDSSGGNTGVTEKIYSFIVTDGYNIYLSNCANWALTSFYLDPDTVLLAWETSFGDLSAAAGFAGEMTNKRHESDTSRYKVYAPDGGKSVSLSAEPLSYAVGSPGKGEVSTLNDPDGIATRISDIVWLDSDVFVLICDTTDSLEYFKVVGSTEYESGYGTDYSISGGRFEIVE